MTTTLLTDSIVTEGVSYGDGDRKRSDSYVTLVVIGVPQSVTAEALVNRFDTVSRGKNSSSTSVVRSAGVGPIPAVRFCEKTHVAAEGDKVLRIAFVDISGGVKIADKIVSAYNGSKWYGQKIIIQKARRPFYLKQLHDEWNESELKNIEPCDSVAKEKSMHDNRTTHELAPLRIRKESGGILTVFCDAQERRKKRKSGQHISNLDRREKSKIRGYSNGNQDGLRSRAPKVNGIQSRLHPSERRNISEGSLNPDKKVTELVQEKDEEDDVFFGTDIDTEEAIANERARHNELLAKIFEADTSKLNHSEQPQKDHMPYRESTLSENVETKSSDMNNSDRAELLGYDASSNIFLNIGLNESGDIVQLQHENLLSDYKNDLRSAMRQRISNRRP